MVTKEALRMEGLPIYLDFASTTPVKPAVVEAMLPFFTEHYGNASSATHQQGWYANGAIKRARKQVADAIGCEESEVVFTSGASEAINLAIKGIFELYHKKGNHIVVSKTEHKAVLDTVHYLEKKGAVVTYLDVDTDGLVNEVDFKNALQPNTILAAVMWVNNETGVIQPVEKLAEIAFENNVPFLSDGTQALGKVDINMTKNHIGVMPISGHKIFGPKGVGALFVRRKKPRISLGALIHGGGQERNLRAGTSNTPGIVGLGMAAELAAKNWRADQDKNEKIKQDFIEFFKKYNGNVNGVKNSSSHVLNVQIPGIKADQLIKTTRNICYSLGSACTSETLDPSHVLTAMGLSKEECFSSFRLSFSPLLTKDQIEKSKEIFSESLDSLTSGI